MQKLLTPLLLLMLCCFAKASAQNHVPNCSFEQYTACPSGLGQLDHATGWLPYNTGTPDYYNVCGATGVVSVPSNFAGWQAAAHGNAYTGIGAYAKNDSREYISTTITPLQVGTLYEVSISVSLADTSMMATSDLAVRFLKNAPASVNFFTVLGYTPHVSYSNYGIISDRINWTRLTGYFKADSTYDRLLVGNFLNNALTNKDTVNFAGQEFAYYYIDSVVVRPGSRITLDVPDTLFCTGDTISTPFTVNDTSYFTTGNTFTLQISNVSGSFASPTVLGTKNGKEGGTITSTIPVSMAAGTGYRLRIISSNTADTSRFLSKAITIISRPAISASSNSPVCENASINLSATSTLTGTSFGWTGPASYTSTVQNPVISSATVSGTGDYIVIGTKDGCSNRDTVSVLVNIIPSTPVANNSGPVCAGGPINLTASSATSGVSYAWSGPASFSSATQNPTISGTTSAMTGTYSVTATKAGCTSPAGTTNATIIPLPIAQAGAQLPVCVGGTIQLIGNSLAGATYQWTGPSFSSTSQSPSFAATSTSQSGNYILKMQVGSCMSESDTIAVKVNILSRIGGYASPNDTICLGTIPTFVAFVQDGGPAPVTQWYRNHVPVGSPNTSPFTPATINNGDIYYCKLTAPGVCFTTLILYTDTIEMVVQPVVTKPEVTITASPGLNVRPTDLVTFTANVKHGGASPKYQWYKNGMKQTGAVTATFATTGLSYMDMIHVDIISDDPCAQDKNASDTVWMQFPTAIKESPEHSIKLYPNPNKGAFMLTGIKANWAHIEIVNMLGQAVYRQTNNATNGSLQVDADLPAGAYMLRLHMQDEQVMLRFNVAER